MSTRHARNLFSQNHERDYDGDFILTHFACARDFSEAIKIGVFSEESLSQAKGAQNEIHPQYNTNSDFLLVNNG